MIKKLRRQDRIMDAGGIERVLKEASVGFLALVSEDGSPYGIPVNYVAANGKIYIHRRKRRSICWWKSIPPAVSVPLSREVPWRHEQA